jgi:hypothetical protein
MSFGDRASFASAANESAASRRNNGGVWRKLQAHARNFSTLRIPCWWIFFHEFGPWCDVLEEPGYEMYYRARTCRKCKVTNGAPY